LVLKGRDKERVDWVESFKSGNKWFLKLEAQHGKKEGTLRNYAIALKRFSEYMKMTPDEIIAQYKRGISPKTNWM
jgi:hypothetical protein